MRALLTCLVAATALVGAGAPAPVPAKLIATPAARALRARQRTVLAAAARAYDRTNPDFSPLDPAFQAARLVGLGQSTHGSREIFRAQADLFKYLVARHGYRVLLWEDSFGPMAAVDDYVQGRTADLAPLAARLLGCWRTQETGDLFRWMRAWNEAHPQDRVRLLGIDLQKVDDRAVQDLRAALPPGDRALWEPALDQALAAAREMAPSLETLEAGQAQARTLVRRLETLACRRTDKDWLPALLAARSLEGCLVLEAASGRSDSDRFGQDVAAPTSAALATLRRDLGMAENILALLRHLPGTRFAVFAHNLHISRDACVGANLAFGAFLAESFSDPDGPWGRRGRDLYCAVGIGTRRGTVLSRSQSKLLAQMRGGPRETYGAHPLPPAVPGSLEGLLGAVGRGRDLLVDLRRTGGWLDLPMPMYVTGSTMATGDEPDPSVDAGFNYATLPPARAFDAYLFLDRTEATAQLKRF